MNRRDFLKGLVAIPLLSLPIVASAVPVQQKTAREMVDKFVFSMTKGNTYTENKEFVPVPNHRNGGYFVTGICMREHISYRFAYPKHFSLARVKKITDNIELGALRNAKKIDVHAKQHITVMAIRRDWEISHIDKTHNAISARFSFVKVPPSYAITEWNWSGFGGCN